MAQLAQAARIYTSSSTMNRAVAVAPISTAAAVQQVEAQARARAASQAAAWYWGTALAVIVWSVSYLLRQPGVAVASTAEPFSFVGDFAIEGMVLALAWLGVLATACIVVLAGVAQIEDPSA